jgi:hypothetical protein
VRDILSDLVAEQQFLDQSLQRVPIKVWDLVTPNKPWTVRDTISHLADFEELGADALNGGRRIEEWQKASDLEAMKRPRSRRGARCGPRTSSNGGGAAGPRSSSPSLI